LDDKNKARCISFTAVAKANRFATLLRCMKTPQLFYFVLA
jgi:hypothetical protein